MTRKTNDIIDDICNSHGKRITWIDRLTDDQREICHEVKKRVTDSLLPHLPIARRLIDQLKLSVSCSTVVRWFNAQE